MQISRSFLKPPANIPRLPEWGREVVFVPEPEYVVIPLQYPGRILYKPSVKIGEQVGQNHIIGRSRLGHCIHAPVSGVVRDILAIWSAKIFHVPAILIQRSQRPALPLPEVFQQYGIPLEAASSDTKLKALGVISPWTRPGRYQEEVEEAFPEIRKIIIRAVDEEPTVFINDVIIQNYTLKITRGLVHLAHLSPRAEKILVVSDYLKEWAEQQFGKLVKIVVARSGYKHRISQLLVPKVAGIPIPLNAAYRAHGVAAFSAEYLLNMVDALDGTAPFTGKFLTVAGTSIEKPVTVKVTVGTTIRQVLKYLKLDGNRYARILVGGPMQGIAQYTDLTPLTKTTHGLYLMDEEEIPEETNLTCTNCGRCTRACPVNLQVHLIGRYAEYSMFMETRDFHTEACLECGICAYVCPAHRPLVQLIQLCKKFSGISNEYPQQQSECGASSALERWELDFQNPNAVDSGVASGDGDQPVAVRN